MKLFATIELFREYKKVKYYTLKLSNESATQAEQFFEKAEKWTDPDAVDKLLNLHAWLVEIGENRGSKKQYFRWERQAQALPPPADQLPKSQRVASGKNVRIYCLRLSDEIVILFNGGLKVHNDPTKCPNVSDHFYAAVNWSGKIRRLVLKLAGREILNLDQIKINP